MKRGLLIGAFTAVAVAGVIVLPTLVSMRHQEDNTLGPADRDRTGIGFVLNAAAGSDATASGAWHKVPGQKESREDARVARECDARTPVDRASLDCITALRAAMSRSADVKLKWGPWSQYPSRPLDYENPETRPDPKTYQEGFATVTHVGDESETLLLIYCVRLGKCQATYCHTKALPVGAARTLASLNRECSRRGHWDPERLDDATSLGIAHTFDAADASRATVMQTMWKPLASDSSRTFMAVRSACNGSGGSRSRWPIACHLEMRRAIEKGDTALLHWYDGTAQHELFVSVSDFGAGSHLLLGHCNLGSQLGLYPYLITGGWLSTDVGCDDITCPVDAVVGTRSGALVSDLLRTCEQAGTSKPTVMGTFVET